MRKAAYQQLFTRASLNNNILFIGSDLGHNTLSEFEENIPDQLIMEGISEGHMLGMAAGLAMENNTVFVNTIAPFILRRGFDQLSMNICRENYNVKILGTGGGLVYGPLGATHHSLDDFGMLNLLPNMTVISPCDCAQTKAAIDYAIEHDGPVYIRLAKGNVPDISKERPVICGEHQRYREGSDVSLITTGIMVHRALSAAELLSKEGIEVGVYHFPIVKPLSKESISSIISESKHTVVLEEHLSHGGLSSRITDLIMCNSLPCPSYQRIGFDDQYPEVYGKQEVLLDHFNLDPISIARSISERYHE